MNPQLIALLLLLVALLGAQLTFTQRPVPLGPRIIIAIGGPFVVLGFLLGPHLTNLLSRETVDLLTPLLALGLGWIGLLFGLQLDRDHLRQFPRFYLVLAWLQAVVAFAVVYAVGRFVVAAWLLVSADAIVLAAAATACVSTPAAIALVANAYNSRGRVVRFLFYAGSLDAVVGIVALELTHAAYHTGASSNIAALSLIEWFAISVLLGCFFGVLFLSLTRVRPRTQEFMLFLIGLVLFASGTAFYLGLSPLFVCMIAGSVIGNLSPLRRRAYAALSEWEKPIYIMTLVLAGALLQFSSWWIVPLVAAYVGARLIAKWLGGVVAYSVRPREFSIPGSFGLALVPQGGITLAMAISFFMIYDPAAPEIRAQINIFLATVVIAVAITDLMGPFLVRAILQSAGELGSGTAAGGALGQQVGGRIG